MKSEKLNKNAIVFDFSLKYEEHTMKKLLLSSFLFLLMSLSLCAEPSSSEREALIALYNATDGDNWNIKHYWKSSVSICEWYGVYCKDDKVLDISLSRNNLKGSIPKEIGNLKNLKDIALETNNLSGSIPKEIYSLKNLESIMLSDNNLTGEIPKEIGNLQKLSSLELTKNNLSGIIPKEIGNLQNLQSLQLGTNKLSGSIPKEIGNLKELSVLNLRGNNLSGSIPKELYNLKNMMLFYLSYNNLSGTISEKIGNIKDLWKMSFSNNNLVGKIPKEIGNLTNLAVLRLNANNLSGTIPSEMKNIKYLDNFALYSNANLKTDDEDVIKLINEVEYSSPYNSSKTNYEYLLFTNKPSKLKELDKYVLTKLYNSTNGKNWKNQSNWLNGYPCSDNWNGITCTSGLVSSIELARNNLSGNIPSELGMLETLEILQLSHNNLAGNIPDEITNLKKLKKLGLQQNNLSGSLPKNIGSLDTLEELTINHNNLAGNISSDFIGHLRILRAFCNCNLYSTDENVKSYIDSLEDYEGSYSVYIDITETNTYKCQALTPIYFLLLD